MLNDYPRHRIEEFGKLSQGELEALAKIAGQPRNVRRKGVIEREGEPIAGLHLLVSGWVFASLWLPDGVRQGFKVHLPGDILGVTSMSSDNSVATLTAVTPAVVYTMQIADFSRLLESHPRLAMRLFISAQRERVGLMDQLASVGRTNAEAKLAALILDLEERLEPLGLVRDGGYRLALTQEQIGDLLGLTSVHVNRTLKNLEHRGLIERTASYIQILDRSDLLNMSGRIRRSWRKNLDWLPAER